jgi:hypothetical protein
VKIQSFLFAATDEASHPRPGRRRWSVISGDDSCSLRKGDRFNVVYGTLKPTAKRAHRPSAVGRFVNDGKSLPGQRGSNGWDATGQAHKGGYYTLPDESSAAHFESPRVHASAVAFFDALSPDFAKVQAPTWALTSPVLTG